MNAAPMTHTLRLAGKDNWIEELPETVRAAVKARMTVQAYAAGSTVSSAGQQPTHMHRVVDGYLKLLAHHASGEESMLVIYVPGNCWAETAIVAMRPLHHSTVALTDVRVASLRQDDFWDLYRRHPEIPEALCRKFALSLSRSATNRGLRGSMPLRSLVAMAFANLAEHCPGEIGDNRCSLGVPIKLADIAAYLDVTRQSVQTAVSQLKERGILEKQSGVWMIHDRERLMLECAG
jgi:CRP/FNR family cyclic AMP-dependent transcriptional regulator